MPMPQSSNARGERANAIYSKYFFKSEDRFPRRIPSIVIDQNFIPGVFESKENKYVN